MKTVLVVAAAFGLSASAAFAECSGHNKVTASADVDKTITTASVTTTEKQSRLPAAKADAVVLDEEDTVKTE